MCCSQDPKGNTSSLHPPKIFLILDHGIRLTNARHPKFRVHSFGGSHLPRFLDNPEVAQMHCNTVASPAYSTPDKITQ